MTIKQTFKWLLTTTFLLLVVASFYTPNDSPETRIRVKQQPVAELTVDSSVRPASAEIDMTASPIRTKVHSRVQTALYEAAANPNQDDGVIRDSKVQLCQGIDCGCDAGGVGNAVYTAPVTQQPFAQHAGFNQGGFGFAAQRPSENLPSKRLISVDGNSRGGLFAEPRWLNSKQQEWEQYAYGEYIGPFRTPHVPDYRIRIGDELEFVYLLNRRRSNEPYRLFVGDTISVASTTDSSLNQPTVQILSDGTVSLPLIGTVRTSGKTIDNLQRELNDRYTEFVKSPEIVIQVVEGNTPQRDLRDAVDARQGAGGQSRFATVSPDGTIQLPMIGSVPAIGLTLEEIGREINARSVSYTHLTLPTKA